MLKNQRAYRKLFSEYLRLISILLQMTPETTTISHYNHETLKLLNEIFVAGDDQWQESVKTYVISLFLADIASSVEMQKCL